MTQNIKKQIEELEELLTERIDKLKMIGEEEKDKLYNSPEKKLTEEERSNIKYQSIKKAIPIAKEVEQIRRKLTPLLIERQKKSEINAELLCVILTELLNSVENKTYLLIHKGSKKKIICLSTDNNIEYCIVDKLKGKAKKEPIKISIYDMDGLNKVFKDMPEYCKVFLEKIMIFQQTTGFDINLPLAREMMGDYLYELKSFSKCLTIEKNVN